MAVRIVTDSSSDLPTHLAEQWDITVVPCYVIADDQPMRDGVDITADEFYSRLESSSRLPTTAQPSAADFQAVYDNLLAQGHQVVSIHVSEKLSGTLNSANQARAALGPAGEGVEIVDSRLASIPLGLVALSAAERVAEGDSPHDVAVQARRDSNLTNSFFAVDTLEYLQKGGRIGKAQSFLGSMLNVKPILTLQDGEAHPLERVRNSSRAVRRLVELTRLEAPLRKLAVIYSTEHQQAQGLREDLSGLLAIDDITVARFGATLGTYLGPRALGVGFTRADDAPRA